MSLQDAYAHVGTAVLDDGVPRPLQPPGHGPSRITGGPSGWLFGFDHLSTLYPFVSLAVTPDGVTIIEHEDFELYAATDIVYADGRVYATNGDVVDVATPTSPKKIGTLGDVMNTASVLPWPAEHRLLMVTRPQPQVTLYPMTLLSFDTQSMSEVGSYSYESIEYEAAFDLCSTDGKTLAFIGADLLDDYGTVYLLPNPF